MAIVSTVGGSNSNSYVSVADATAYHASVGNTDWTSVTDKESALVRATMYLDSTYYGQWAGDRYSSNQALDWPRSLVYIDGVLQSAVALPVRLIQACCEVALRASQGALDKDLGPAVKSESVGDISTVYAERRETDKFVVVDKLVRPLLQSGSRQVKLVRV